MLALLAAAWLIAAAPSAGAAQAEPAREPSTQSAPSEPAQPPPAAAQEPTHVAPQGEAQHAAPESEAHQPAGEHGGEGGHEAASPWGLVGRIINFALLAGGLVYLLRSPFAVHLNDRASRIHTDLASARTMRDEASGQMAAIEERLKALPAEIAALKARGAQEIAAEQVRLREATEAERQRLLEQARREVDGQVRAAERALLKRAGELAVSVATERVRRSITANDQERLVERYLAQVGQQGPGVVQS